MDIDLTSPLASGDRAPSLTLPHACLLARLLAPRGGELKEVVFKEQMPKQKRATVHASDKHCGLATGALVAGLRCDNSLWSMCLICNGFLDHRTLAAGDGPKSQRDVKIMGGDCYAKPANAISHLKAMHHTNKGEELMNIREAVAKTICDSSTATAFKSTLAGQGLDLVSPSGYADKGKGHDAV